MTHLLLAVIYLAFISLGFPDGLLGAAWPSIQQDFEVPLWGAGLISIIICFGTIISSLQVDRLNLRLGTGRITALSVLLTAIALFGFALSREYWMLLVWALPYGLGAGCIDASLNNYVAIHYASRHMSWLHSMWGIGAAAGPAILGHVLSMGLTWQGGYGVVGGLQLIVAALMFASLPLWRRGPALGESDAGKTDPRVPARKALPGEALAEEAAAPPAAAKDKASAPGRSRPYKFREVWRFPGAASLFIAFFAYCGVEQTTALWAGSYFVMHDGIAIDIAAGLVGLFYLGIMVGRLISGFATLRWGDKTLVRVGEAILSGAIVFMLLPLGAAGAYIGVLFIGFGCAPIFPCLVHATPENFGRDRSQAVIGIQMACGYCGVLALPPLFGALASALGVGLLPLYLAAFTVILILFHERLQHRVPKG